MRSINLVLFSLVLVAFLAGCNGIGIPTNNPFAGNYAGTYRISDGPDRNQVGAIGFTVHTTGVIAGAIGDVAANQGTIAGHVNPDSGRYNAQIRFPDGTPGTSTGEFPRGGPLATGSGTFTLDNGNSGTFTFVKT